MDCVQHKLQKIMHTDFQQQGFCYSADQLTGYETQTIVHGTDDGQ